VSRSEALISTIRTASIRGWGGSTQKGRASSPDSTQRQNRRSAAHHFGKTKPIAARPTGCVPRSNARAECNIPVTALDVLNFARAYSLVDNSLQIPGSHRHVGAHREEREGRARLTQH
jgi:hypothetical protein